MIRALADHGAMPSAPRLSAHIGYLYTELPLRARIAAARADGFTAVEHPDPSVIPPAELAALLADSGMAFAQMTAASGDPARGEKGLAALPGREAEFRAAFARALDYAEAVGCPLIHPMAGVVTEDAGRAAKTYRANLAHAVEAVRGRPVRILIEAISAAAVPGYALSTLGAAKAHAEAVSPDILLLVDTFHAAATGEDLAGVLPGVMARVGHIHIADFPGRHEPGSGGVDFAALLTLLAAGGYGGAIGFEYIPSGPTAERLGWMAAWRERIGALWADP